MQLGQRLLLTIDNDDAAAYLRGIDGVQAVEPYQISGSENTHSAYLLEADAELAPEIAAAVIRAGDKLFGLQPEVRNLETVFAEVNTQAPAMTEAEAA